MLIFNRHLNVELVNAVAIGLEIADSRAVWTIDKETGEIGALPFMGIVIYLPFILITFGQVYEQD